MWEISATYSDSACTSVVQVVDAMRMEMRELKREMRECISGMRGAIDEAVAMATSKLGERILRAYKEGLHDGSSLSSGRGVQSMHSMQPPRAATTPQFNEAQAGSTSSMGGSAHDSPHSFSAPYGFPSF